MWWWGEQEAAGAKTWLAETVALYQKKHPNVTIKTVLQTTDGLVPAFKAAAAAKKGPDIQYFWGGIWSLDDAWARQHEAGLRLHPAVRAQALPEREGGHVRRQGVDGAAGTCSRRSRCSTARTCSRRRACAVPHTWAQLLAACDTLNAKGITPIAGGIKDGWFGGWLYSIIGAQGVTSISDVLDADDREGEVHRSEARRLVDAPAGAARPQVLEQRHQLARALPGPGASGRTARRR